MVSTNNCNFYLAFLIRKCLFSRSDSWRMKVKTKISFAFYTKDLSTALCQLYHVTGQTRAMIEHLHHCIDQFNAMVKHKRAEENQAMNKEVRSIWSLFSCSWVKNKVKFTLSGLHYIRLQLNSLQHIRLKPIC